MTSPPSSSGEAGSRARRWLRRAWLLPLLSAAVLTAQEEYRPLHTGGLGAESAALLLSGQEGGSIPLFVLALPSTVSTNGNAPVELFVEVPGSALLAGHDREELRIELCLYALAGSRVVDSSLETVELLLSRDREALLAGGIKSRSTLELAAGRYVVRVLVRNVQTGELGLRSFSLEVPAADAGPILQSLLVPDPAGAWLRLARGSEPPTVGFWPAARPVLAPGRDAELQILARGLDPGSVRLELSGDGGESIEVPAVVSPAKAAAPAGLERWLVRARVPSLEPGDYELSLRMAELADSPHLPVVVREDGVETWAGGGAPAADTGPVAEAALPKPGDQRGERRKVAALTRRLTDDYRAALARLPAADLPGAIAALGRLEAEAFDTEGGASAVADAELETARALASEAPTNLVPLFDLHYRAYRRYLAAQRFRLSSHARDLLLDLVDIFLARRPADTRPATDILVVLGDELQEAGLARYSSVIFRRALAVDPKHPGALLGLAAGLEKHGQYAESCDLLETLLEAHPGHREGKLRLAVNLARTDHSRRARRLLGQLVEQQSEDWVLAVAYHELTRDFIARGRLAEAESLLAAAGERLPGDDQLRLQLAAVRDALRSGAGDATSDDLAMRSRAERPSARHRYQQWPRYSPSSSREDGSRYLEALASALQDLGGET